MCALDAVIDAQDVSADSEEPAVESGDSGVEKRIVCANHVARQNYRLPPWLVGRISVEEYQRRMSTSPPPGWGNCQTCKPDGDNQQCKGYTPVSLYVVTVTEAQE